MTRAHYNGTTRKLVLAFDIGTTYSGAAYAFLDPDKVPEINSVTKYLDNPNVGTAKVPSILYYDQDGNFRGVENGTGLQDDEDLLQLRWWKLMLGPTDPPEDLKKYMSKHLPKGKTIVDVFSDFMRYLFDSTKTLFISSDQIGESRWNSVSDNIELILTHPNGWGGPQQSQLRTAAVKANIIPDTQEGRARVHFVTEGEASFNFCATQTQTGENLKHGDTVLVVDAGGGTIDISSYVVTDVKPLQVEELFQSSCLIQGGELVTARAREMISEKLKDSMFNTPEEISTIAQVFDGGVKKTFADNKKAQYIKFGCPRDNDSSCGIKLGKLTLLGNQVSEFFEPSIQSTVDSIRENFTGMLSMDLFAFLVGGFGSSPWLSSQLDQRLSDLGLKFFKPDTNTGKAVAVGAVSYYIDHFVQARITKFAYGTTCSTIYKPSNPDHVKRKNRTFKDELGHTYVPDVFTTMLSKGTKVLESRPIRKRVRVTREGAAETKAYARIIKYDGNEKKPGWMDVERDKFETLCQIYADISAAPSTPQPGTSGKTCYYREFDVVLLVGLTELKAEIRWTDAITGVEASSDAHIMYDV